MEAVEVLDLVLSNYQSYIVMGIQFLLGLTLGYVAVKALKYVVAFIGILLLGSLLSMWSLNLMPEDVLSKLGKAVELAKNLATVLGILVVGPASADFLVGALIALLKK